MRRWELNLRAWMVVAAGLWAFTGSAAAEEAYGLLKVASVPPSRIVDAEFNAGEFAAALRMPGTTVDAAAVRALVETKGGVEAIPVQYDAVGEGKAHLSLVVPGDAATARVRLYLQGGGPAAAPTSQPLGVRQEAGRVIVNNGHAEIVHDPKVQGGLLSKVTLLKTGATFDGFFLNDRVYDAKLSEFSARLDPDATVRVLRAGPIEAVVEVRARYIRDGQAPESHPVAVYEFTYQAGNPAIAVTARCSQEGPFRWQEHHLMECHFPTRPFKNWAGGSPRQAGAFQKDDEALTLAGWGALTDGANVVGIASDQVRLYSGTPGYGCYVHGPWTEWTGAVQALSCSVWLDADPGAIDRLESYAKSTTTPPVVVTTSSIEQLRQQVEEQIAKLPQGPLRGVHRWWLSLAERFLAKQNLLGATRAALEAQAQTLSLRANPEGVVRVIRQRMPCGPIQMTDSIGIMWSTEATGCSPLSLFSFSAERELLSGKLAPLWSLDVEASDGSRHSWSNLSELFECTASPVSSPEGYNVANFIHWGERNPKDGRSQFVVQVTSRVTGATCKLQMKVTPGSGRPSVLNVQFPQISFGAIGTDPADDVFFQPTVSGTLAPAPLLEGLNCSAGYPSGWGSMQFMAYWDPDCGFYLGVHDPLASTKTFHAKASRDGGAIKAAVEWPAPDASRPGNGFDESGETVLTAFHGDWFDAARLYRAWVEAEAPWWPQRGKWGRPDTPQWMRDVCVWAQPHGTSAEVVGPVKKFAEFMGVPTAIHWYTWHEIPFDTDYPHYFPAKPGFAEGVAELQKAGVRVMPYINGRLWDSGADDFQSVALPAATKDRDGKYCIEEYGSGRKLVPMCPTQKLWRDKVSEVVLRLLGPEFNVDGVYIDQVAAAGPRLCFDATHGHPLCGGHWWTTDGYWPMLTSLNQAIDAQFPQKMLTTECTGEPYTHVFDGYLSWHYQYQNAVPAVAAVYGSKVQLFGRAYNGDDQLAHRMRSAQALVFGEQLGWIAPDIVDKQPVTAAHLRRCARVRHQLLTYLSQGVMERPPKVSGNIPRVTAKWAWSGDWPVTDSALQCGAWRAEDGSVAFIFANSTEHALPFTWHFDAAQYGLNGNSFPSEHVDESTRTNAGSCERQFQREMSLGPLAVQAVIIAP